MLAITPLDILRSLARNASTGEGEISEISEITPLPNPAAIGGTAIIEFSAGSIPLAWTEGVAALSRVPAPAAFSPERWRRIVDAAGAFLEHWGAEAVRCGWSDLDVFGCDPGRPDARFDAMGLVMLLDRREVVGMDEGGADLRVTGATQRFRRRGMPAHAVPLWKLADR